MDVSPDNCSVASLASDMTKVSLLDNRDERNLTSAELEKHLEIEKLFKSNLSQQLIEEYRRYAIEQHPKDVQKQKELIKTMQEDYFNHYMENVQQSLILHQNEQIQFHKISHTHTKNSEQDGGQDVSIRIHPLIPAQMWIQPDISTFKKEILTTAKQCCIKISSLSTATVSVPTHIDGASVWWEFATDNYDLGFGLFFEWSLNPSDQIFVTISDSDDEEDEDYSDDLENGTFDEHDDKIINEAGIESGKNKDNPEVVFSNDNTDQESGRSCRNRRRRHSSGLPTDELIPIIRRDCHEQVYCGKHQYPGQGRYLFKFDNSFSLIRPKWLYYRVYYSKE